MDVQVTAARCFELLSKHLFGFFNPCFIVGLLAVLFAVVVHPLVYSLSLYIPYIVYKYKSFAVLLR